MQVYDPTAPNPNAVKPAQRALGDLNGKVVGFIDNAKPNFNLLAEDISALLTSRYGVKAVVTRAKRGPSMPAATEIFDELARDCDLVITGSGD